MAICESVKLKGMVGRSWVAGIGHIYIAYDYALWPFHNDVFNRLAKQGPTGNTNSLLNDSS